MDKHDLEKGLAGRVERARSDLSSAMWDLTLRCVVPTGWVVRG